MKNDRRSAISRILNEQDIKTVIDIKSSDYDAECQHCGKPFKKNRPQQRYCSQACYDEVNRERSRQRGQKLRSQRETNSMTNTVKVQNSSSGNSIRFRPSEFLKFTNTKDEILASIYLSESKLVNRVVDYALDMRCQIAFYECSIDSINLLVNDYKKYLLKRKKEHSLKYRFARFLTGVLRVIISWART